MIEIRRFCHVCRAGVAARAPRCFSSYSHAPGTEDKLAQAALNLDQPVFSLEQQQRGPGSLDRHKDVLGAVD
jgi:hypothetical protein